MLQYRKRGKRCNQTITFYLFAFASDGNGQLIQNMVHRNALLIFLMQLTIVVLRIQHVCFWIIDTATDDCHQQFSFVILLIDKRQNKDAYKNKPTM